MSADSQLRANDTWMARLAGVCALLSTAAEYAAIAIVSVRGDLIGPASFGSAEGLTHLLPQSRVFVVVLVFGLLAPFLTMVAWLAMYRVVARGGSTAFSGVIVSAFGMFLGVVAESLRLAMVMTLPSAYVGSSDAVKPAILALGGVLGKGFAIMDYSSLIVLFAIGVPLIAIAIIRGRALSVWLGWALLIPTICVGYIGAPLLLLGHPIADVFMALGMNLFFLTYVIIAVQLLRWRPAPDATP